MCLHELLDLRIVEAAGDPKGDLLPLQKPEEVRLILIFYRVILVDDVGSADLTLDISLKVNKRQVPSQEVIPPIKVRLSLKDKDLGFKARKHLKRPQILCGRHLIN